jgi:hypothetical protein
MMIIRRDFVVPCKPAASAGFQRCCRGGGVGAGGAVIKWYEQIGGGALTLFDLGL